MKPKSPSVGEECNSEAQNRMWFQEDVTTDSEVTSSSLGHCRKRDKNRITAGQGAEPGGHMKECHAGAGPVLL